jgi:hypothetical protein
MLNGSKRANVHFSRTFRQPDMVGPEPLGSALNHHSGRDPQGKSAPLQAHYGIYRTPKSPSRPA